MRYSISYRLKQEQPPYSENYWWYVQGVARDESGRAVRWSVMTGHCDKENAERMYHDYYEQWNNDPQFNTKVSGDLWLGKRLP